MPEPVQPETRQAERSVAERAADHAAIAGSIEELLPALIAKLGATGLAELEVRQDALRVRLRRPADAAAPRDRRAGDRADRGERSRGAPGSSAAHAAVLTPVGPGRDGRDATHRDGAHRDGGSDAALYDDRRAVATSPAVGIYQPRADARAGTKVRAGDRLGTVDMLGVLQEVAAPTDGLIGASLVEPGDAVEYGQKLVIIEFAWASSASPGASSSASSDAAPMPPPGTDR
ncbi:MAG: hypothetical protein Q7S35_05115 [Candidatus Limnocylindrales bacterium]|nr:hypothetical protein [Candidatus Limnocylindrales bacterium]